MAKATHKGHCQICNRLHMLPGGRVAKHGYTVHHGYFNGVCSGSDALPYEQDKTLLEKHVIAFEAYIAENEKWAKDVLLETDPKNAWRHEYREAGWGPGMRKIRGGYYWTRVEYVKEEGKYGLKYRQLSDKEGKWKNCRNSGYYTPEIAAKAGADYKSDMIMRDVEFDKKTLAGDQQRLKDWKPNQPLTPRKE